MIFKGPAALCGLCKKTTEIYTCGLDVEPKTSAVLSQNLYHRLLWEATERHATKHRWSSASHPQSEKWSVNCRKCCTNVVTVFWFNPGNGYVGPYCEHCAEKRMADVCGHEEDGAVEKVRILSFSITKSSVALLKKYMAALEKKQDIAPVPEKPKKIEAKNEQLF